jgi:hypothetical protein
MAGVPPNSLRQDELPEYSYQGPFGGIQSEVSLDKVGRSGFAEVQNVMFWKSQAQLFPAFTPLSSPSGEIIIGIADFFNVNGVRISVVWTPTRMFTYTSGVWTQILGASSYNVAGALTSGVFIQGEVVFQTGGGLATVNAVPVPGAGPMSITGLSGVALPTATWTGSLSGAVFTPTQIPVAVAMSLGGGPFQFMQWDVVGYMLYFSQQFNKVMVWDGVTAMFSPASPMAVPAKYVCELNFQLLAANTLSGGQPAPNRVYWTAPGSGIDWVSFGAGQNDLFNGLGPINGLARIYQAGYAFQQFGICQIIPTGIGTTPFEFISMGSRAKGSVLGYGVATFGEIVSCYVGKNDVYVFDGTQSTNIGSKPIDGNRRLGARSRIFSDLFTTLQANAYGIIASEMNGNNYESYWLFIPNLNKAWIYHFDEQTWTQQFFTQNRLVGPAGILSLQSVPEIQQLIGTIASQSWSPSTLGNANPLDTLVISDAIANSVAYMAFGQPASSPTAGSLNPADGWYIRSGQLTFDDPRHGHSVTKIRLCLIDYAATTIYLRLTNEFGQTSGIKSLSYGTGSGATLTKVLEFKLAGKYITWEMSGPQGVNWGMSEIAAVYDVAGEVQGGNR